MWPALVTYCAASWGLALLAEWLGCFKSAADELCYPPHVIHRAVHIAMIAAPVWVLPVCAWVVVEATVESFRDARLRRKCRIYKEYVFTPVNYFELDAEIRGWFDRRTGELFPLGFRLLGDYQLKEEPVSVIDRFFWHDSRAILGVSSAVEASERDEGVVLISWLADGVCVTTTKGEDPHPDQQVDPDADRMWITWAPDLATADLYARHVQEVTSLARRRQTDILIFDSAQLESLVIHDQRLFHQWVHKLGNGTPPPEPVLPPAVARISPDELQLRLTREASEP